MRYFYNKDTYSAIELRDEVFMLWKIVFILFERSISMRVGVPKEIKVLEFRVGVASRCCGAGA